MARVTVEDCIDKVENRFELVLLASHRARLVSSVIDTLLNASARTPGGTRTALVFRLISTVRQPGTGLTVRWSAGPSFGSESQLKQITSS